MVRWLRSPTRATGVSLSAAAVAVALAACGGSSGSGGSSGGSGGSGGGSSGHSPLTVGVITAFSGPQAFFGATDQAACESAARVVTQGGGVLGHQFTCKDVEDHADPADAVPAVNSLLATSSNLTLAVSGNETPTIMPLFTASKIPDFSLLGDPSYDTQTSPYFFRFVASDALSGKALGYYAASHGYKRVASVFTSSAGAQTSASPAVSAYKGGGGSLVSNLTLQPGSTDYRTEAAALVSAHPDAIMTEMDRSTATTFFQEVAQLNGGKVPPLIGTSNMMIGGMPQTLVKVLGPSVLSTFRGVVTALAAPGAAFNTFYKAILSFGSKIQDPKQYKANYFAQAVYDSIVVASLAMIEAHSTSPSTWVPMVTSLTNGVPGAVTVHTFAAGKAALAAGKKIRYVGVIGPINLNKYHNTLTPFAVERVTPGSYQPTPVGHITPAALAAAK